MSRIELEMAIITLFIEMVPKQVSMPLDCKDQTLTPESSSPSSVPNSTRTPTPGESKIHLSSSSTMESYSRPQSRQELVKKPPGTRNSLLTTLPEKLLPETS
jgi:hypothetical protein